MLTFLFPLLLILILLLLLLLLLLILLDSTTSRHKNKPHRYFAFFYCQFSLCFSLTTDNTWSTSSHTDLCFIFSLSLSLFSLSRFYLIMMKKRRGDANEEGLYLSFFIFGNKNETSNNQNKAY